MKKLLLHYIVSHVERERFELPSPTKSAWCSTAELPFHFLTALTSGEKEMKSTKLILTNTYNYRMIYVERGSLELPTLGLKIRCSAN